MKPEQVHPTHDVREEGILASDPVCQRCRASVYDSPTTLLVECSGHPPTVEQYLTVQPASGRITELERQLKVAREAFERIVENEDQHGMTWAAETSRQALADMEQADD